MSRRSRQDLILDIMEFIGEWNDHRNSLCRRTRILFRTNVTWTAMDEIIKYLLVRKWLEEETLPTRYGTRKNVGYRLTPAGQDVIRHRRALKEQFKRLEDLK